MRHKEKAAKPAKEGEADKPEEGAEAAAQIIVQEEPGTVCLGFLLFVCCSLSCKTLPRSFCDVPRPLVSGCVLLSSACCFCYMIFVCGISVVCAAAAAGGQLELAKKAAKAEKHALEAALHAGGEGNKAVPSE